jgi:multisubunit Na+/H+ antiporter MnhC subunit
LEFPISKSLKGGKNKVLKNKKGQTGGLVSGLVFGIAGLVIGVIIALVIVSTLDGAGLLTANGAEDNAVGNLTANFTSGIDKVSAKIPTVLLVAAIVLILGVLAVLVGVWQKMRMGGSI